MKGSEAVKGPRFPIPIAGAHPTPPMLEIQAKSITLPRHLRNYRAINNPPEKYEGVIRVCRRWWGPWLLHGPPLLPSSPRSSSFSDFSLGPLDSSLVSGLSVVHDLQSCFRICDPVCSNRPASPVADRDCGTFILFPESDLELLVAANGSRYLTF